MRRTPRGFTLVELMVSIVLFSIAIAGVLSVATSIAQGFREQRAAIATEGQVRMPMDFLTDAIRQAGPAVPTATNTWQATVNTCTATAGIQAADLATCDCGAIGVTNSTSGPDTLDLVYASGAVATATTAAYSSGMTSLAVADASQLSVGDTILISNLSTGITVGIAAISGNTLTLNSNTICSTVNFPGGTFQPFSTVVRVQRARFTVQVGGDGVVPNDGIPVLMMQPGGANGGQAAQPLAEGVEDMQIALGVDVNGNGFIDAGEWAYDAAGHGALTGPILAVKILLVGRAVTAVSGGAQTPFTEPVAFDHTATLNGPDAFRRRTLEATIELRNMGGSP